MWLLSRLLLLARYSVDSDAGRWSMLAERKRGSRERFLVSVSDAVSGESLAELHHSGARDGRANVASSPLFLFLTVVLVRSGHVLRWRLDLRLPQVPRGPRIEEAPWSKWRERETRIPDEPQSASTSRATPARTFSIAGDESASQTRAKRGDGVAWTYRLGDT